MFLKLIVVCALIRVGFCYLDEIYSYQLPNNLTTKSLKVTIISESFQQFQITIECYNYDSLKYFEVRLSESTEFKLDGGVLLNFINCFNNATDNGNSNYSLSRWFNSLPYFSTASHDGYPITIQLDEYAEVNSDVLFKYFDFKKFDTVTFKNIGFTSTEFLTNLYCRNCIFQNTGVINFNDFSDSVATTDRLYIIGSKLINLNRDNLKKFTALRLLDLSDFDLDDCHTFNVPDLFTHNVKMTDLILRKSKGKIALHEHVFRGLKNLESILLVDLHLDCIPKNVFNGLNELTVVNLSSNNIKMVDPCTFKSLTKLSYISLTDNPFYTEPHNKLKALHLDGDSIRLELGNFTVHTFDLLELLIKNPKINDITFQSFLIDKLNITDFQNIRADRNASVNIGFQKGNTTLDVGHINTLGNIIRSYYDFQGHEINALVRLHVSDDEICHDCTMIKNLFPYYFQRFQNRPGFYLNESRTFIEFKVPESCDNFEEYFEEDFIENCPPNCACKFSPLLDKVKIDCGNRNLTEIPHILYPKQFCKVHSIDLNFENNSVTILSLANQDANVLAKLSTLNFNNNKLETLQIGRDNYNIWALNICDNPIVSMPEDQLKLKLASGYKSFNGLKCYTKSVYPHVVRYIRDNKSRDGLNEYLNCLKCK